MKKMIAVLVLSTALFGCTAADLQNAQAVKDQVDAQLVDTKKQVADLQGRLTTMPSDTAGRDQVVKVLDQSQAELAKAQDRSAQLQTIIDSLKAGQVTPGAINALSAIPVVGPYMPLVAVLLSGIGGWWASTKKANGQLATVLAMWHNEDTPGPTPALTAATQLTGVAPAATKV